MMSANPRLENEHSKCLATGSDKYNFLLNLNIDENWLINNIISWKLKKFRHIKCHSDLERAVMECIVSEKAEAD